MLHTNWIKLENILLSETASHKRTQYEVSRIVLFIETETRKVVTGGGGVRKNGR